MKITIATIEMIYDSEEETLLYKANARESIKMTTVLAGLAHLGSMMLNHTEAYPDAKMSEFGNMSIVGTEEEDLKKTASRAKLTALTK